MLRQVSLLPKRQFVGMRLPLRMLSTKPLENETPDYYRTLGVPSDASLAEVKAAYRQLAKEFHPDLGPAGSSEVSEERFRLINDAYEVLSSAAARERYDSTRIDIIDKLKWKNEGYASELSNKLMEDTASADASFRKSLFRANERFRKGAAFRGSINRENRARIHVPTKRESLQALLYPAGVAALWVLNYFLFVR